MNVLTEDDRAALLQYLTKYAPDDLLVRAVEEIKEDREFTRNRMIAINKYIGHKTSVALAPPTVEEVKAPAPAPVPAPAAKHSTPPGIACSRVGSETKELILGKCLIPSTLEEINAILGRTKSKLDDTQSVLKRLWSLKLISFDGTRYAKI